MTNNIGNKAGPGGAASNSNNNSNKGQPGADYNKQAEFLDCCYRGELERIRFLAHNLRIDVNCKYDYRQMQGKVGGASAHWRDGMTALMFAVFSGRRQTVQFLVKHGGINVNEKDSEGETALMYAALKGEHDIIEFLVKQAGARVNEKDHHGMNALMKAIHNGHRDMAYYLLKECGAEVNERTHPEGMTALMYAAKHGYDDMVEFLLTTAKANVNEVDQNRKTAYDMAGTSHGCSPDAKERTIKVLLKFLPPLPKRQAKI